MSETTPQAAVAEGTMSSADAESETVLVPTAAAQGAEAPTAEAQSSDAQSSAAPGEADSETVIVRTAQAAAAPDFAAPPQPPVPVFGAEYLIPLPPAKRKRRFPWRWAGAVVTALAVGAGCAFAVMAPQRTDLPGLHTASDGRYDFAPLELPTLAPGQADPTSSANAGNQHLSDIRKLLLNPPQGAVLDSSLPGATGWVPVSTVAGLFSTSAASPQERFPSDGLRHTAAIGWKTPDGATTKLYLLQFIDDPAASDAGSVVGTFGGSYQTSDQSYAAPGNTSLYYTKKDSGSSTTWYGNAQVGDTQMLIVYTAADSIGMAPFQQEADLQIEMLL